MPASAMISASPSLAQVMPVAPASSCLLASSGILWVLTCGRSLTPLRAATLAISVMLAPTTSRSMTSAGVSISGYIGGPPLSKVFRT